MKSKIFQYRSLSTDLATLMLRVIFGGLFTYYGYNKFISYDEILPQFPDLIHIGAKTSFILVIFAELVCGFLVAIGLLTRLTIIPIFITMFVAFFIAHKNDPFQVSQIAFVYLLLSIVIFILGSGKFSVDRLIFKQTS